MIKKVSTFIAFAAVLFSIQNANALISCTVSSNGFTSGYVSSPVNSASFIITQAGFDVTCTRGTTLDLTTTTYSIQADGGLNPSGGFNVAKSGANSINYNLYTNSVCGTKWQGNVNTIPFPPQTITMSGLTPTTVTQNFWACIPSGQILPASGTYTDIVTVTPTYDLLVLGGAATFPISIVVPAVCSITSAPGAVIFVYTAFSASAVTANTTYGITCSNSLPYSMSVSPASSVVAGINYSLSLSSSAIGNGLQQIYTISGNAPSGQAGTCATSTCSASQITTLTITY